MFRHYAGEALLQEYRARWLGPARGWDPGLWRPMAPPVPPEVLRSTELLLRDGKRVAGNSRL